MKTSLKLAAILCALGLSAQAADTRQELENATGLRTRSEQKGINNLIDDVRKNGWAVPYISSQWHVDNVSKPEQKQVAAASREFGKTLAKQLADMAGIIQQLPASDELYQQTIRLCNLSDWCASVDGYGNVLLAQRALDLAAVGIARLAANLEFPMEKTNQLLNRLHPSWMSLETRWRILNRDAGVEIFPVAQQEDIEQVWASGKLLLLESRDSKRRAERATHPPNIRIRETKEILQNLSFFNDLEVSQVKPTVTLVTTWDLKWHERIINGLELQSVLKAQALAEFRRVVGSFPEKSVFSPEEIRQRDQQIAEAAKQGIKIVPYENGFDSPGHAAFRQAWEPTVKQTAGMTADEFSQRRNQASRASQAYEEVKRGAFLDQDSQQMQLVEPKKTSSP